MSKPTLGRGLSTLIGTHAPRDTTQASSRPPQGVQMLLRGFVAEPAPTPPSPTPPGEPMPVWIPATLVVADVVLFLVALIHAWFAPGRMAIALGLPLLIAGGALASLAAWLDERLLAPNAGTSGNAPGGDPAVQVRIRYQGNTRSPITIRLQ